jgi:tetratricopeptide (TPR) repeat protein
MNFIFRRDVYGFLQLLSLLMPLTGYIIDVTYQTSPGGFITMTLAGVIFFLWAHVQQKKTKDKKDTRAIDWISKGCTFQIAGSHQEAVIAFTKACELEPRTALTYFARGRSYFELGNLDQAIKDFDRAIELNPKFIEAYDRRGLCHAKLGKHELAVQDFDKAIDLNPHYAVAYNHRIASYEMLGNYELSMRDVQAAAKSGNEKTQNPLKS